jgi:ribonuclease HI
MRAADPQPLDLRAPKPRYVPGAGGITLICMFPTKSATLYNVPFNEATTRIEMMTYISEKLGLPMLNEDFFEAAPLDWFEKKRLTVRYQLPRRDITSLEPRTPEEFVVAWDPTVPAWIETDGACSGNPGVGGWGAIINQGDTKVEIWGPNANTTNNEMELQALDEALKVLPVDFKGYVTIESDSENAIKVMTGLGKRWQIDNFILLKGTVLLLTESQPESNLFKLSLLTSMRTKETRGMNVQTNSLEKVVMKLPLGLTAALMSFLKTRSQFRSELVRSLPRPPLLSFSSCLLLRRMRSCLILPVFQSMILRLPFLPVISLPADSLSSMTLSPRLRRKLNLIRRLGRIRL